MFKKFQPSTDIAGQTQVKSSVSRSIRASVLSQWKIEPETLEAIWPKKESLVLVKCREHLSIYTVHSEPIIFQHFDGPFYPTLRILHQYPYILPIVKIDRGAIRFLLAGAHMMCPGLTSAGGYLPSAEQALSADTPVAILAEGKEHAVGVGITKMSTEDMRKINKGVGVETTVMVLNELNGGEPGDPNQFDKSRVCRSLTPPPSNSLLLAQGRSEDIGFKPATRFPSSIRFMPQDTNSIKEIGLQLVIVRALFHISKDRRRTKFFSLSSLSEALQKALDELNLGLDTIHILCLGLGSPASSQNTRLQLALLLDICESFRIVSSNVSLYDPVFTDDDFRVFEDLGFVILTDDKESRYVISQHPTLLYMPHCDKSLYEHVLQINWNADTLSQVIFISNRFQDYLENNAKHILEAESPHVLRLGASVDCFPLPTFTPCPSAFNNTAIQHIPAKRLAACLTNG